MSDKEKVYTQSELETQKTLTEIKTMLGMSRMEFSDHKEDDEKNFGELFKLTREIRADVAQIPATITGCRDDLKKEMHNELEDKFVTQEEFTKFTSRITYTLSGVMMAGSLLSGLLSFIAVAYNLFWGG